MKRVVRFCKQHGAQIACATLAMLVLPGAKNGCGSKESNETLTSPVQAVTALLEQADGTVEAELVLISTTKSPHTFVDTAKNAMVRVPGGAEVPLSLGKPGHYTASTLSNPALQYVPGETYQFKFELDDASAAKSVAGGNFVAVMDAPDDQVSFSFSAPPAFAGDTSTIEWSPSNRYAIIKVRDAATNEITYSTFNFEEPQFDGSKWARLEKNSPRELGVDTFPDAGDYVVSMCAVDKVSDWDTSLSAELGWLSGFLIGRCAPDQTITVQ